MGFDRNAHGVSVGGITNDTAMVVATSPGLGRYCYFATSDFESLAEYIGLRPFLGPGLWVVEVVRDGEDLLCGERERFHGEVDLEVWEWA